MPGVQAGPLKKLWIIKKHPTEISALVESLVHFPSNNPKRYLVGCYLLEHVVPGADLYALFDYFLRILPASSHKSYRSVSILKDELVLKSLEDLAWFQTHPPNIPPTMIEQSQCKEKLPETMGKYITLSGKIEHTLKRIGKILDEQARYNFRDAALWNVRLHVGKVISDIERLLGTSMHGARALLQSHPSNGEVAFEIPLQLVESNALPEQELARICRNHLYHYDFNTANRLTFPADDFLHVVDTAPMLNFSSKEKLWLEAHFLSRIKHFGGLSDTYQNTFYSHFALGTFYRHLRFWDRYQKPTTISDFQNGTYHFLSAYHALHGEVYGDVPPSEISMRQVLSKGPSSLIPLLEDWKEKNSANSPV